MTWGFSAEAAKEVEVSLPSTSASVCGLVHPPSLCTNSSHLAPLLLRSLQEGACTMNAMGLLPCHKLYIYPSDDISPLWSDSSLMAMVVNGSLSPQVLRNIEDFTRQI